MQLEWRLREGALRFSHHPAPALGIAAGDVRLARTSTRPRPPTHSWDRARARNRRTCAAARVLPPRGRWRAALVRRRDAQRPNRHPQLGPSIIRGIACSTEARACADFCNSSSANPRCIRIQRKKGSSSAMPLARRTDIVLSAARAASSKRPSRCRAMPRKPFRSPSQQ